MPNIKRSVNAVTSCTKQRKIADEYVRLCGYKNDEHGNKLVQNGPALSLKEIAAQLGTIDDNWQWSPTANVCSIRLNTDQRSFSTSSKFPSEPIFVLMVLTYLS